MRILYIVYSIAKYYFFKALPYLLAGDELINIYEKRQKA